MIVSSHTYPIPNGVKPVDYDVLYQMLLEAKKDKDYKRADELRDWFEFWHGQTIIREGKHVYSWIDKSGNPTGTVVGMRPSLWLQKYFNYLVLAHPSDYTLEGLSKAFDSRRGKLNSLLESMGYVTYSGRRFFA